MRAGLGALPDAPLAAIQALSQWRLQTSPSLSAKQPFLNGKQTAQVLPCTVENVTLKSVDRINDASLWVVEGRLSVNEGWQGSDNS